MKTTNQKLAETYNNDDAIGTVGELIDMLSVLPRSAVVSNPDHNKLRVSINVEEDECDGDCENCNCDSDYIAGVDYTNNPITSMAEHMMLVCGDCYTPDALAQHYAAYQNLVYPGDKTAMTNPDMRGPVVYQPNDYEITLPPFVRKAIDEQRGNNTGFVNDMLAIETKAIMDKARIDIMTAQAKYELLAEYNTQCDMHMAGTMMCQIVSEEQDRNNK